MKHKHYDCIVAWAAGKKIELFNGTTWIECIDNSGAPPSFDANYEYRIKKEPVIEVKYFYKDTINYGDYVYAEFKPDLENWHLKITYKDGKAIKAELPE